MNSDRTLNTWDSLSAEERLQLREEYGHYLDDLPPTCSMDIKIDRFCVWLNERGIRYEP